MNNPIDDLITACRELDERCAANEARLKQVQALANEARTTGRSQAHRLNELPPVCDISTPVAKIRVALKRIK